MMKLGIALIVAALAALPLAMLAALFGLTEVAAVLYSVCKIAVPAFLVAGIVFVVLGARTRGRTRAI